MAVYGVHDENNENFMKGDEYVLRSLDVCLECGQPLTPFEMHRMRKRCSACMGKDGGRPLERTKELELLALYIARLQKPLGDDELLNVKNNTFSEGFSCLECVWGSLVGDKVFCPFPDGVCGKNEQVFKNAVYDDDKFEGMYKREVTANDSDV